MVLLSECDGTADILVILDTSGSIRQERFPQVREFMINVIRSLEWSEDRIQVAATSFSDEVLVEFTFQTYDQRQDQIEALRRVTYVGGKTNIADVIKLAREEIFTSQKWRQVTQHLINDVIS